MLLYSPQFSLYVKSVLFEEIILHLHNDDVVPELQDQTDVEKKRVDHEDQDGPEKTNDNVVPELQDQTDPEKK